MNEYEAERHRKDSVVSARNSSCTFTNFERDMPRDLSGVSVTITEVRSSPDLRHVFSASVG